MGGVKLLKASAGSGKTYQLTYEYVSIVVRRPEMYRHILAVTFTNKATEEMKARILLELSLLADGKTSNYLTALKRDTDLSELRIRENSAAVRSMILHDYSRFSVVTIDKFFQRIIRGFIKELGIDINFNLELRTDSLLSSAVDQLIEEVSEDLELRQWLESFIDERIEQGDGWDVKHGVLKIGKVIFTEDYKLNSADMATKQVFSQIILLSSKSVGQLKTKMQNAANLMIDIIASNGLSVSDFAYGKSGVMGFVESVSNGNFKSHGARIERALGGEDGWYTQKSSNKAAISSLYSVLAPLLEEITSIYSENKQFIVSYDLLRKNYRNFALLSDIARKMEQVSKAENIMPISQTNSILNKLISDNDAPFIFEKVGNHFYYFMMDEFQDTSTMQWNNFLPLLHNAVSQSIDSPVLIVGDVKQSIYRWRGGDWRILAEGVNKEFDNVTTESLETNYRSMKNIVNFNNELIERCVEMLNTTINSELEVARSAKLISNSAKSELSELIKHSYEGHYQEVSKSDSEGLVTITLHEQSDEAPVIQRIEELQDRGYDLRDIAILVRRNSDGVKVANLLMEKKRNSDNPKYRYDVLTREALTINNSPVVDFVLACLKLSYAVDDNIAIASYNFWLKRPFNQPLSNLERDFTASIKMKSPMEAFELVLQHYNLENQESSIAYLQALHDEIINFSSRSIGDIALFVKWWSENGDGKSINIPQSNSAITIISIHKAKGLQYPVVLIPYTDWNIAPNRNTIVWSRGEDKYSEFAELGVVPLYYSADLGESIFSEEYFREKTLTAIDNLNILYVGVTRAENELHIMIPKKSSSGTVAGMIQEAISLPFSAFGGDKYSSTSDSIGSTIVSFGSDATRPTERKQSAKPPIFPPYTSYDATGRLKLRLKSDRFLEDSDQGLKLSPRGYGIMIHKAFEDAETDEDILHNLSMLQFNGEISNEEYKQLSIAVGNALKDSVVGSWFRGKWERVINEGEIISPSGDSMKRPDRVMIDSSGGAVLVDYKFGLKRLSSHRMQIKEYAELLGQMGYKSVKGYIWYVSLEDVEPVI